MAKRPIDFSSLTVAARQASANQSSAPIDFSSLTVAARGGETESAIKPLVEEDPFKKKVDTGLSGTTGSLAGVSKPIKIATPVAEEGDESFFDKLSGIAGSVKNSLSPAMRALPVNTLAGAVSFATNLVTGVIKGSISEQDFKRDPYLREIIDTIERPSKNLSEAAASVNRAIVPQIELAKKQAGIKQEYLNAPISEVMTQDVGQGFKKLALGAIEQIPQLGLLMASGGGSKARTFIAGTTLGTTQAMQQEFEKDGDISGIDLAQSAMKGVIEGLTEMIFNTDLKTAASIGKSIVDVTLDGSKKAIKDLIEKEGKVVAKQIITRNYKDVAKNGLKGMSEESLEEVIATGASFVVDTIDSGKLNTKDYERLKYDLIDAGLLGAAIGGPISVFGAIATKKSLTEEQKSSIERFQEVANNTEFTPNLRNAAKERIKGIIDSDADLIDEQYNKLASLPLEQRIEAFNLLGAIKSSEGDSRKIKDIALQEDNNKIIDDFKSRLDGIFEANKPSAEVIESPKIVTPEQVVDLEKARQEELAKAEASFKVTMGVPSEPMKISPEFSVKAKAEDLGINTEYEPSPNMPLDVVKKDQAKPVQFTTKESPDALLEGDVYTVNQGNKKFATILSTNRNGIQEYYVPEMDNPKPYSNLDDAKFAVEEKLRGRFIPEIERSGIDRLRADKFIPKADIVVKNDNGENVLLDADAKKSIQNAVKAFKSVSTAPVYLYKNTDDFKKGVSLDLGQDSKALDAAGQVGGGFFTNQRNEDSIHINLANLNQTTIAHELFHGTVVNVARQNPSAFAEMRDAIVNKLGENDLINVKDEKGNLVNMSAKEYLDSYSKQYSPSQQAEEFLGELTGLLTTDIAKLKDPTIWETIKLAIRNLVKTAGIDIPLFEKTANVNETVKFFNDLAKSLQTGKEINISKLKLKDEKQAAKQGDAKGKADEQSKNREKDESLRNDVEQVVEQRRKGNELGKKKRKLSDVAAKAMAIEPTTPEDYALQYFINGGLVIRGSKNETVEKDTLFTLFSKARMGGSTEVVSEMRARVRIVGGRNAGGLSISEIAEKTFAEYQQATKGDVGSDVNTAYDYMDFKSAVEAAIMGNKSDSGMAASLLASKNKSTEEDALALTEDEEFEKMRIKAEAESMGMTEQELLDKISELENTPEIQAIDEAYAQALNMINDEDFAKLYELDDSDIAKIDELMAGVESNQGELDDKLAEQKKAVRDLESERKKVVSAMEKASKETQLDITGKAPIQEQLFGADTKSLTDRLQSVDAQLATAKADVAATQTAIDFQERGTADMFEQEVKTEPKRRSGRPLSEESTERLKISRFGGNEQLEAWTEELELLDEKISKLESTGKGRGIQSLDWFKEQAESYRDLVKRKKIELAEIEAELAAREGKDDASKEEKILLDGVEVTRDEAIKKSRESIDYETYGSKMEYNGKDSQTKDFVKEYNRRANPYTPDGQLKGDFIQKGLIKAFNEIGFRKFGDLYRKHIDSFFSKENYQNGLGKNFTWEEKAGYVIGDSNYDGMGAKYAAFAKEAGIIIPENAATKAEEAKPAKFVAKATELQQEETELISKPNETVFDTIARIIQPNIDEAIEKSKAKIEEKGEVFTKSDAEYIKLSLEYDLLNATGKYLEDNDKIVSSKLTRAFNNTFNLDAVIKRGGKDYYFKTKSTLAGGYNVQRYHYRYLVDSNLPKSENNDWDYLKTRINNITKAKDIDNVIKSYERNIGKYQEEIDTYENMSDEEYLKDWYFKNLTWNDIVKRGADKNYEGGKAEFEQKKADDRERLLEGRKRRIETANRNIKSQEAAIAKEQQKKNELDPEYLQEQVDSLRADVSLLNIESEEIGERRNNAYFKLRMHEDRTKVLDAKEVTRLNKLIKELDKEQAPIRKKMSQMREEMQRLNKKSGYNLDLYAAKFQKQGISVAPKSAQETNAQFLATRNGTPIGFNYDTDLVARERFNIPTLKKIGEGSDRVVFDLGDNKVLKVAKTARGLAQNIHEGSYDLVEEGILPEVFESGLNYIVADKVEPAKGNKAVNDLIRDLKNFTQRDFDTRNPRLQDVLEANDLSYVMNYDVLYGDLSAARNWGVKNGKPIHLDGGTFGGVQMINQYKGVKNLEDSDFRDVYNKSRQAKAKFGDKDTFTKFQKQGVSVAPTYKYQMNEMFKDPQRLISDIRSKYDLKSTLRERGKVEGTVVEVERKLTDNIVISALSKIGIAGFKTIGAIENAPLFKAGTGKTVKLKEALTGWAGYAGNNLRNATLKAIQSNNKYAASGARVAASLFGNLAKTNELQARRKALTGSKTDANNDIALFSKNLNGMIGFDNKALMRVHSLLDPEAFEIMGSEDTVTSPSDLTLQELRLYNVLRDTNDFIHEWHYQNEFIDQATYDKHKGKYFARMYEEIERKEFADLHDAIDKMPSGADFRMFKARKDFSEIELTLMNDPIYITSKRLATMLHNKATLEFSNAMAADPSYTTYKNAADIPENNVRGFKLLDSRGGGKRYGDLTNRYVPLALYEELRGTTFANKFVSASYDALRMYDGFYLRQFFKKSKTLYNPTTRLGNITTNFAFAWLAGVDPFTMMKNRVKAKDSLDNYDDFAKDLAIAGVLGTDVIVADLSQKKDAAGVIGLLEKVGLNKEIADKARVVDKYMIESYGRTDDVAKISLYRSLIEDYGKSKEEALRTVGESMQNYATVGKAYQYFSKVPLLGNPFVKFSSDMARIVANGFANRPLYMASFLGMMYGTARLLSNLSGEPEDEREARESRAFIPKIPLGFTDIPLTWKVGKYEINAARFISPYYVYDAGYRSNTVAELTKFAPIQLSYDNKVGFASDYTPVMNDPFIAPLAQVFLLDKDFRGLPIADPNGSKYTAQTVTEGEALWNRANYLGNSYASPIWGYVSNLYAAATGQGDIYGRRRDIPSAILNSVIKVQEMESKDVQKAVINQVKYIDSEYKQIKTDITSRRNDDIKKIQEVVGSDATEAQKENQIINIRASYSNFVEERVNRMNELKLDRQLPLERLYKIQNPKKND